MNTIFYQESGQGFPLVLIHGFCENNEIWSAFREKLSKEFRVICPDLPGFGKSALPDQPFSLEEIADLLAGWLKSIDIKECVMIGHSLGGYVTMEVLRKYPAMIRSAGLFNSSAFADPEDKKANRTKLIDFISREGVEPFIKTFVPSLFYPKTVANFNSIIEKIRNEGLSINPKTVMLYAAAMRDRTDYIDLLQENTDKILLISGEYDQNVTLDKSKEMGDILNKRNFHIIPDSAHMSMFEQEELCLRIVREFTKKSISN